jgi:hypothetical protein
MAVVQFAAGVKKFSELHKIQTEYESNSASYPMSIEDPFPYGKAAGA